MRLNINLTSSIGQLSALSAKHFATSIPTTGNMAFVNAKNKVPELQRQYQAAYRAHTRVWKINPRSNLMMTPFLVVMWGSFGLSMWAMGRKVAGYNSFWGKD